MIGFIGFGLLIRVAWPFKLEFSLVTISLILLVTRWICSSSWLMISRLALTFCAMVAFADCMLGRSSGIWVATVSIVFS